MPGETKPRFPSPFEVGTPPGCEGWESMYPYYYTFSEARKEFEEGKLWFFDGMHHPDPMTPFDTITAESWWVALSQYNSRVFMVPPALGIDHRILNGYTYISANAITDPKVIEERVAHFMKRAGYYYSHWDELYQKWEKKATEVIRELEAIEICDLPDMEDEDMVTEGKGISSGYRLIEAYDRLIQNMYKIWQYHFEFLNLGYAAYLTFVNFCKKAFPDIGDQTVAKMVAGIDVILFRPDEELKKLATLAVELGVADVIKSSAEPDQVLHGLSGTENGRRWLEAFEAAKNPWFYLSTGTGFYHSHVSWIDNLRIPFAAMVGYINKLEAGESLERPLEEVRAERERLANEYYELLTNDEDRNTFKELLGTARTVFPYVENHLFYVEHWHHTIFWNKMRELARIFVKHDFFRDVEDIWYLHRFEIGAALYDLVISWAVGTPARGPSYWPQEIERRKAILDKLRTWAPPPALGVTPDVITEPFTIMLWGITSERIRDWLSPSGRPEDATELSGFAASPGVVEGPARVIVSIDQLAEVEPGEILVCPITSPSWAPVFTKIRAAVTDIGGIMSHAAIVCREYGLPAVVGVGYGTKSIKTGDHLVVDGNTGTVKIIR